MTDKLYLTPDENFPEDRTGMADQELQVLDSQIQRQLDYEVASDGESNRETEFRHYEIDGEFQTRNDR